MPTDSDNDREEALLLDKLRAMHSRNSKRTKELSFKNKVLQSKVDELTSEGIALKSETEKFKTGIEQLKTKLEKHEWQASKSIHDLKIQCEEKLKAKDDVIADLRIRNERLEAEWKTALVASHTNGRHDRSYGSCNGKRQRKRVNFAAGRPAEASLVSPVHSTGGDGRLADSDVSEPDDQVMNVPETMMIDFEYSAPSSSSASHERWKDSQSNESRSTSSKKTRGHGISLWDRVLASDSDSDSDLAIINKAVKAAHDDAAKVVSASSFKRNLSSRWPDHTSTCIDSTTLATRVTQMAQEPHSKRNSSKKKATIAVNDSPLVGDSNMSDCSIKMETDSKTVMENQTTSAVLSVTATSKRNFLGKSNSRMALNLAKSSASEVLDDSFDDFQSPEMEPAVRVRQRREDDRSHRQKRAKTVVGKATGTVSQFSSMTFEPLSHGCRQIRYKQMTLTQTLNGERNAAMRQTQGNLVGDEEDLNKALQNSLEDSYPKNPKSSNGVDDDDDDAEGGDNETHITNLIAEIDHSQMTPQSADSHLDETYVSSTALARHRTSRLSSSGAVVPQFQIDVSENESEDEAADDDIAAASIPAISRNSRRVTGKPLEQVSGSTLNESTTKSKLRKQRSQKKSQADDFDVVPQKQRSPSYKYKADPTRKRNERRRLDGHECKECEEYFADLPEEERKQRLNACSRHRAKHVAPSTPPHFWSIDYPSTQECKDRGYMENTQHDNPPISRRRRQL